MDRRLFLKLLGVGTGSAALASCGTSSVTSNAGSAAAVSAAAHAAVSAFIANPPFSFTYSGQPSAGLLRQWRVLRRQISSIPGRTEESVTWRAPSGELQVQAAVVFYEAYGAIEWTVSFSNPSSRPSEQLTAVLAADTVVSGSPTAQYVLHHFNGSAQQADDYAPQTSQLAPGTTQLLFPVGGRPSNGTWPYFNISWGDRGVMVAIGWPGQWTTQLLVDEQKACASRPG